MNSPPSPTKEFKWIIVFHEKKFQTKVEKSTLEVEERSTKRRIKGQKKKKVEGKKPKRHWPKIPPTLCIC